MSEKVVGNIEGYDVIYIPERDILFCKNTTISYPVIKRLIEGNIDRAPLKSNLTYVNDGFIVSLGCLTTNKENCKNIIKNIKQINK